MYSMISCFAGNNVCMYVCMYKEGSDVRNAQLCTYIVLVLSCYYATNYIF